MKILTIILFHTVLLSACFGAAFTDFDYSSMTAEEIALLRSERHLFYSLESAGKEEAIKQHLLDQALKLDGNQSDYDVRYYGIDLDLDFSTETISGLVSYKIMSVVNGLNSVDLNLRNELTVDSITVEGQIAPFSHINHLLSITTLSSYNSGEEFEMVVYYGGQPYYDGSAGMMFNVVMGYPMCWTKATPYRSRYWWPCKDYPRDKPDSIDMYIERPEAYDVATNGVVISDESVGANRKRVHYKHNYPIATYCVALVCAEFVIDFQTWDYDGHSMPVYSYTLANNGASKDAYETHALPVLTTLSDCFGTYPFVTEKCGNANFGWYGAMEHQTCNMYAVSFYTDWVIAHENGHQWWGDMITCRTFNHIWLNEGFASYCEPLYVEARFGTDAYHNYMSSQKYLGAGTIYVDHLIYDSIYVSSTSYDKASWVLHMLRGLLGDSLFFQALHDWGDSQFKYGSAVTADFTNVLSTTVGEDMSWFIDQWIYGEGSPEYDYSWICEQSDTKTGYNLLFFIEQTQEYGNYFKMPIKMTFQTTSGQLDTVLWNEGAAQFYEIPFLDSVTAVDLDPQEWILRIAREVPFVLHMIPRTLPDGYLEEYYHFQLLAVGGVPPYDWSILGGDLPLGLVFDPDSAVIKGIPTWPATYFFTMQITDSDSPPSSESYGYSLTISENPSFICGDADANTIVEISDAVYLINYVFVPGSPAPEPLAAGDVDCNGIVEISDAVYLISYIFLPGSPPPCDTNNDGTPDC